MVLSDNGKTSRYTYNASGERIVKSHGNMEGVYVNGAPQRIASKIGVGRFNNVYGINGSRVTAGLKDLCGEDEPDRGAEGGVLQEPWHSP